MDEAIERAIKEAMDERICCICKGGGCHHCDSTGMSPIWRILEAVVPKTQNRAVIRKIDRMTKLCYCGVEYSVTISSRNYAREYAVQFPFATVAITVLNSTSSDKEAEDMFTAILESRK